MSAFAFWISALSFNDGTELPVERGCTLVLVGPNNSGKSRSLRDIESISRQQMNHVLVVKNYQTVRLGDAEGLKEYVESNFSVRDKGGSKSVHNLTNYSATGGFVYTWDQNNYNPQWGAFLVNRLDIEQRLHLSRPTDSFDPIQGYPMHPLHKMYEKDELQKKMSSWTQKAFKSGLAIDLRGGSKVTAYFGNIPAFEGEERPTDTSYVTKLRANSTPLHEQGDGVRAFAGILMSTLLLGFKVHLIDEPEAFLHPPQAQLLGEILSQGEHDDFQLIVATHSGDFLRGLLRARSKKVQIARIQRIGTINVVRSLSSEEITFLWSDPVLLYSNILDGLFHQRVVVCESEADSRFYGAVYNALKSLPGNALLTDVMFAQGGGKHATAKLLGALHKVGVSVRAVLDIDVLREERPLRDIIEAVGGTWGSYEQKWKKVQLSIAKLPALKEGSEISAVLKAEILQADELMKAQGAKFFPAPPARKIEATLKARSPGALLKQSGRSALQQGQETADFDSLILDLEEVGIHVVTVGELERFVQDVGGHGPKWVQAVLETYSENLLTSQDIAKARNFVEKLVVE